MKLAIAIASTLTLGLASCKKDYTCICYDHFDNIVINTQVKAKSTEKALDECGKNYSFVLHSTCGVNQ